MPPPQITPGNGGGNALVSTGTGKMALFTTISFGLLIVLDKMMPGTGLLFAVAILLVYLFRSDAVNWIVLFFRWVEDLTK